MNAKHVNIRIQKLQKRKIEREEDKEEKERNETKKSKKKTNFSKCGSRNYASFSGFNKTRIPAPLSTAIGLILYAKDADFLRLLIFLMQK